MSSQFDEMAKVFNAMGIKQDEFLEMLNVAGVDVDEFDAYDFEAGERAGRKMAQALQSGLFSQSQQEKFLSFMVGQLEGVGEMVYECEVVDGEIIEEHHYQNGKKF